MITATGKVVKIDSKDSKAGKKFRIVRLLDDDMNVHDVACFNDAETFVKGENVRLEITEDTNCVFKSKLPAEGKGK